MNTRMRASLLFMYRVAVHTNHFTVCDAGKVLASLFVTVIAKVDTNDQPFVFCLQFVYFRNSVQMLPPFIPKT